MSRQQWNVLISSCKMPIILPDFNQIWSFSTDFCEGPQTSNFTSMRPVGAAPLKKHAIIKYFVTTVECHFMNGAQNLASTLLWTRFYHLSPRRFAVSGQTWLTTWTKYRCGIKAHFDAQTACTAYMRWLIRDAVERSIKVNVAWMS